QNGMSSYFLSANRNKRSIAVDLKRDQGIKMIRKLVEKSDVIVENFRPGTLDKLGLSYERAKSINPGIVYCSLSGYGQTGPFKDYPAYDLTLLSYTGLLSITGEENRPPVKFGVPIADIVSGLFAVISIMGALQAKVKMNVGQHIDMSMFDSNLLTLTHQAHSYFATGKNPRRLGSAHASIAPYQVFASSDGYISISVGTEKLWLDFIERMGLSDLRNDPRFTTNVERVKNRDLLAEIINSKTVNYTTSELAEKLRSAGIPCAPINTIREAVESDQALERQMNIGIDAPYGSIRALGTPFKLSKTPGSVRMPPPMLGEHTSEILREIGYSQEEILDASRSGVVNSVVKKDEEI
ncbi:MAG: CaiB/BaiF CoA-transferase family protein, partial [Thermoplasmataceae archaeon]